MDTSECLLQLQHVGWFESGKCGGQDNNTDVNQWWPNLGRARTGFKRFLGGKLLESDDYLVGGEEEEV